MQRVNTERALLFKWLVHSSRTMLCQEDRALDYFVDLIAATMNCQTKQLLDIDLNSFGRALLEYLCHARTHEAN